MQAAAWRGGVQPGGEPTIHRRFFDVFDAVLSNPDVKYTLISTNGVIIARDEFATRLDVLHRKFENYLRFHSPQQTE